MTAVYWITFDNGEIISVSSADARSFKRADIRAAYRKARAKAEAKLKARGIKAKVVTVRCVG